MLTDSSSLIMSLSGTLAQEQYMRSVYWLSYITHAVPANVFVDSFDRLAAPPGPPAGFL